MAGERIIDNPALAFRTLGDPRVGTDVDGKQLGYWSHRVDVIANVAIAVGDVLTWVVPTATAPIKVTNAVATGGAGTFLGGFRFAGVCTKAAAAGGLAEMCDGGFVRVQVGSGTPTIGDMAVLGATAAQADVIAAGTGVTAGTFVTNVLGIFMSAAASNLASLWLHQM